MGSVFYTAFVERRAVRMKKKVALYGMKYRSIMIRLMQWLSPDFEVVAWISIDEKENIAHFSGKMVVTPENIKNGRVDYIIVPEVPESDTVIKKILECGIKRNRILDWRVAKDFLFENNILCMKQSQVQYEGLILGMSYSYWGLFTKNLEKNFFKLSMPAMDLFYMNKQLQEVLNENYLGKAEKNFTSVSGLKYIILEMPYYMFNYDLSQNKVHIRKQMILADYFQDYHHFDKTDQENLKILEQFNLWKDMFYQGERYNESYCYFDHIVRNGNISDEMKERSKGIISHVWAKRHEQTIEENIEIFGRMIKCINDFDSNIKIVILVMPQSKYEYISHKELIEDTKHEFEAIIQRAMQQYNVSYHYCDYFKEYFDNDEYMLDLIHLNGLGADHFSRKFDELLKKEVYIH